MECCLPDKKLFCSAAEQLSLAYGAGDMHPHFELPHASSRHKNVVLADTRPTMQSQMGAVRTSSSLSQHLQPVSGPQERFCAFLCPQTGP